MASPLLFGRTTVITAAGANPATQAGKVREIVVGVDESDGSRPALVCAAEEALRRQAPLRVVTAFESAGRFGARYGVPIPVTDEEIAHREGVAIRKLVDEVLGTAEGRPQVRIVVVAGATGPVLVEQSRTAQLLVVGHRGRGELASTLLGSVGLYCVLHAHSPVLVVRPPADAPDDPSEPTAS
jgi:nucleotide-binding universal stress UspA family protein